MPDQSNVLNIPCDRCGVGWMVVTPEPRTLEPVELHCSNTPRCRATQPLWTSTYLGQYGSGWVQWCLSEDFSVPSDGWPSWLLYPRPNARILVIDTYADLEAATARYGYDHYAVLGVPGLSSIGRSLDFDAIARDYDAVHLTEEGQWRTRLSHPLSLYGWDCESTCWLTWAFDRVEFLGDVAYSPIPDEVAVT